MTTIEDFNRMLTDVNRVTLSHDDRIRGGLNEPLIASVKEWHRFHGSPTNEKINIHNSKIKLKK